MVVVWDSGDRSFAITTDIPNGLEQTPVSQFLFPSLPALSLENESFHKKKKKKALQAKTHSLLFMHCRLSSSPKKLPGHIYLKHMIVEEMKIEAVMTANIPVQL